MIIVNSLLYIHYLCSEHHLLVVTVTIEKSLLLSDSHHINMRCIDLHYVVVNLTTIHIHYRVVIILGSNVHFKSSGVHYSVLRCILLEMKYSPTHNRNKVILGKLKLL